MNEGPEVSVLVHELGGMLSSVQGFAHIAESNPDHPDRERFIKLTASEARRAAQALKDLHLARALDRGGIPESPDPVALRDLLGSAPNDAEEDALSAEVRADPAKLSSVLSRVLAASPEPPRVRATGRGAEIALTLGPADELERRRQALEAPYPQMVLFSLTRRLLERWGGGLTLGAEDGSTVVTLRFEGA